MDETPKELKKPLTERSELSSILKRYAKKEPWIAAENPKCPKKDLIRFSKDENPAIRISVAKNDNAPLALVKRLAKDKDQTVRNAAGLVLLGKLNRKEITLTKGELFDVAVANSVDNLSALILFKKLKGSNTNDPA
jgi:hypothetical protein